MKNPLLNMFLGQLKNLSQADKKELIQYLQETLQPEQPKSLSSYREVRENRFKQGVVCVHCKSNKVKRFGTYRNRQRYYCNDCKKTFNDLTKTPLHGTIYPEKWPQYIRLMLDGVSIAKCAKQLNINVATSFAWRHKILHAIAQKTATQMDGIVEADETYQLLSLKGSKILPRKSRKRGGKATLRGISREQACILVVRDRNKQTIAQLASYGRINKKILSVLLDSHLAKEIIFCSDGEGPFKAFCKAHQFRHKIVDTIGQGRVQEKIYHIQNVNSFHSRYNTWQSRFNGIATKYLNHYLAWFRFIEQVNSLDPYSKMRQLVLDCTSTITRIQSRNFSKLYNYLLVDPLCSLATTG